MEPSDRTGREPLEERESISRVLRDPAGYMARAQARAARLRSPQQLAVIVLGFALIAVLWFLLFRGFVWLHWYPRAPPARFGLTRSELASGLLALSALFVSIGPGLMLSNLIARLVTPIGRALDAQAEKVPGADYASSQRGLAKLSLAVLGLALPFILAGVLHRR